MNSSNSQKDVTEPTMGLSASGNDRLDLITNLLIEIICEEL